MDCRLWFLTFSFLFLCDIIPIAKIQTLLCIGIKGNNVQYLYRKFYQDLFERNHCWILIIGIQFVNRCLNCTQEYLSLDFFEFKEKVNFVFDVYPLLWFQRLWEEKFGIDQNNYDWDFFFIILDAVGTKCWNCHRKKSIIEINKIKFQEFMQLMWYNINQYDCVEQ